MTSEILDVRFLAARLMDMPGEGPVDDIVTASLQRTLVQRKRRGMAYHNMFVPAQSVATNNGEHIWKPFVVVSEGRVWAVTTDRSEMPMIGVVPKEIHDAFDAWMSHLWGGVHRSHGTVPQ